MVFGAVSVDTLWRLINAFLGKATIERNIRKSSNGTAFYEVEIA
jgi:hypothetical protein